MPAGQTRDQRIVTFLTRDERRQLQKIADDSSVSVSRACYDLIVRSLHEAGNAEASTQPATRTKK
jgi:hypothetical protein